MISKQPLLPATAAPAAESARLRIRHVGEMADLVRSHRWRLTSLGAIQAWPAMLVEAVNMLCLPPDVSEQRRVTAALLQTKSWTAVGRLASSIAHEINNPLGSVTNLPYLMRRSRDLDEVDAYTETTERALREFLSSRTKRCASISS